MPHFRASLIDRLIDETPRLQREARPLRAQTRRGLRESLRRDLTWLLNTRTPLTEARFDETRELTTIHYGMPSLTVYTPGSEKARIALGRRITRVIEAFEPRLTRIRVQVMPSGKSERGLRVRIEGMLQTESAREPVSFLSVLQSTGGGWEVHESQ